ncbi:hypothetical protein BC830DRAFT_1170977 [Chytriomyces sp. MP71]|nr:hypothetical protein BC830DRAFT_1170977 [Chytriomyces sp. MP71]
MRREQPVEYRPKDRHTTYDFKSLLASTITNPAVNIAPRNKQPLAWFDKYNQFEIGSADRLGYNWTVQTVWSNLIKACVSRLPTSVNGSVNFTLTSLSATGTKITGAAPKKLSLTTTAKQNSNTNKKAASSTTAASNLGFPSSNKSTSKSGLKSATKRV